jgi:hypothetical protein
MNSVSPVEHQAVELVDIIDFKWLMARDGHHIHVERLQVDPDYAAEVFAYAAASPIDAVRDAAARLMPRFRAQPLKS